MLSVVGDRLSTFFRQLTTDNPPSTPRSGYPTTSPRSTARHCAGSALGRCRSLPERWRRSLPPASRSPRQGRNAAGHGNVTPLQHAWHVRARACHVASQPRCTCAQGVPRCITAAPHVRARRATLHHGRAARARRVCDVASRPRCTCAQGVRRCITAALHMRAGCATLHHGRGVRVHRRHRHHTRGRNQPTSTPHSESTPDPSPDSAPPRPRARCRGAPFRRGPRSCARP